MEGEHVRVKKVQWVHIARLIREFHAILNRIPLAVIEPNVTVYDESVRVEARNRHRQAYDRPS